VTASFHDTVTVTNLTLNQVITSASVLYDESSLGPIAGGSSAARQFSFTLPTASLGSGQIQIAVTTNSDSVILERNNNGTASTNNTTSITVTSAPTISWDNPTDIVYRTALSGTQLDATANLPGTFDYTPAAGTVLHAGNNQILSVTFTPTDTTDYVLASATATINVIAASTSTAAADTATTFSTAAQNVALSATITSSAGTVNVGTETFTILNGTIVIGSAVTVNVVAGVANGTYSLPANTPVGVYTIQAVYNGTTDFGGSTDTSHSLTVSSSTIAVTGVSVEWGSQIMALQTASDGVRLLPAGRNMDMPWFSINRIALAFSGIAQVAPGDVSATGITVANYGPVTISGAGTGNIVITLAKPITGPDRVTIKVANAQINYTRRLDVLPGDVNDDGVVNTTDGVLILNNQTPAHTYNVFDDMNGDNAVNTSDFTLYRPQIGTTLPKLPPPQLAAGGEGPGSTAVLTPNELTPVLAAAIAEWTAAGLPAQDVSRLRQVTVRISDLPAGYLGASAIGGTTIYLSIDAAGYGWSADSYLSKNADLGRSEAAAELVSAWPVATGHEDLLTVVMHELGHTLGLSDLDPRTDSTDLMAEALATGVRRLPSAQDVAKIIAAHTEAPSPGGLPVPMSASLVDAAVAATHDERISLSPAPIETDSNRIKSSAISERTISPQSIRVAPQETGLHGRHLVVTYQPGASSGGDRRGRDRALANLTTKKARS
jgi:hypothetical protein